MDKRQQSPLAPTISMFILLGGFAMTVGVTQVVMTNIVEDFQLVSAQQGLMFSMSSVGGVVGIFLMPLLQGRVRKTWMLLFSAVAQAAMLFLAGFSVSYVVFLVACTGMGCFGGWIDSYVNACMMDIHRADSAKYMGILHGCFATGSILSPLLVQGLLFAGNWSMVYVVMGCVFSLITVQFFVVYRMRRELFRTASDNEEKLTVGHMQQFMKDRYNLFLVLCSLFHFSSQNGALMWMVRYMSVTYNAERVGSLTVSVFWLCAVASRVLAPRLPVYPLRQIAFGMGAAAVVHTVGILSGNLVVVVVMTALHGLVSGLCIPMLIHESLSRYAGNTSLPTSVIMLAGRVGLIVTPVIMGTLANVSLNGSMLFCSVLAVAGLAMALCGLAVRRKEGQAGRE